MVSGKFAGVFPSQITIRGQLPSGQMHEQPVYTTNAANIPLDKVYVKQRLDMMTAKAWLEDNEQLRQAAIALSMREGVCCAHTKMVTFETTPEKYSQLKEEQLKGQSPAAMSKALAVCSIAVIGGIGVGAVAANFGDISASLGNLLSADAMSGLSFDGFGDVDIGGFFSGFSMPDISMPDISVPDLGVGDAIGSAADGAGDALETVADSAGEMCESCVSCCGLMDEI